MTRKKRSPLYQKVQQRETRKKGQGREKHTSTLRRKGRGRDSSDEGRRERKTDFLKLIIKFLFLEKGKKWQCSVQSLFPTGQFWKRLILAT